MAEEDLERAFAHIEAGNKAEASENHWKAAEEFDIAQQLLARLLSNVVDGNDEETRKIAELYRSQGKEYFSRARMALIKAMKIETGNDLAKEDLHTCHYRQLAHEQLEQRLQLFGRLFAKEQVNVEQLELEASEQQLSLEERLATLNQSLPSGFHTSDERLRNLNQGLNRLGFSLYSTADHKPKLEVPKSEHDQVNAIIAQAKDEVTLLGDSAVPNTSTVDGGGVALPDDDSDIDPYSDDDSSASDELTPAQISSIRELAIEAQAQIAQLLALLETDEGGDTEIEFEFGVGKKTLSRARKALVQATKEWNGGV